MEGEIPAGEGVIFSLEAVFGLMRWPWQQAKETLDALK
jgi:hypothetical protein